MSAISILTTRHNLSSLEIGLLFAIIIILAVVGSYKTREILAGGERVMVQQTLDTIRLGLVLDVAQQEIQGNSALQSNCINPMDILKNPPANYLGTFTQLPPPKQTRGHWYFDQNQCQLIYQWRYTQSKQQATTDISRFFVKRIYQKNPTQPRILQKLILESAQ